MKLSNPSFLNYLGILFNQKSFALLTILSVFVFSQRILASQQVAQNQVPISSQSNQSSPTTSQAMNSFYDLKVKDIKGKDFDLGQFKGKVTLVVNTASKCGFTPQLKDLEELNKKYSAQGLRVIGFPSNDFKQDSGSNSEISSFAKKEYNITFPLMERAPVTGDNIQPAYKYLTESKSGVLFKAVQWNFEKFLVDRNGKVIDRWNSMTKPSSSDVIKKIEEALSKK